MRKITVTWMDGKQETFNYESHEVKNDCLTLWDNGTFAGRRNGIGFPLVNVRHWEVEE